MIRPALRLVLTSIHKSSRGESPGLLPACFIGLDFTCIFAEALPREVVRCSGW